MLEFLLYSLYPFKQRFCKDMQKSTNVCSFCLKLKMGSEKNVKLYKKFKCLSFYLCWFKGDMKVAIIKVNMHN